MQMSTAGILRKSFCEVRKFALERIWMGSHTPMQEVSLFSFRQDDVHMVCHTISGEFSLQCLKDPRVYDFN